MCIHTPQQKLQCKSLPRSFPGMPGRLDSQVCKGIVQLVVGGNVRLLGSPDAAADPAQKAPGHNYLWGSAWSGRAVGFSWELRQSHLGRRPPPRGSGWCWPRRCFAAQSHSTVLMPLHHLPAWHTHAPTSKATAHGSSTNC